MSKILESILLGTIQGITEFFPVSSSTHLQIMRALLHVEPDRMFDLVCHLGTVLALIIFLRRDLIAILFKNHRELLQYVIAILPLFFFYFLFTKWISLPSTLSFRGFCLAITGIFLLMTVFWHNSQTKHEKKLSDLLWIGSMQGLALIPGFSRSGLTIGMGCMRSLSLPHAIRFSFILSIPTVLGGIFMESIQNPSNAFMLPLSSYLAGFFSAFLFGFFAVRTVFKLRQKKSLAFFAFYCMIIGTWVYFYF